MNYQHTIKPRDKFLDLRLREIWRYRDLMMLFVRRDFVSKYKQTILGPTWFLIQPLLQTIIFTFIFGYVAGISTDGAPKGIFYLAGITSWNYFANCLKTTSNTFTVNAPLFGKVYFPRAVTPLSIIISNLIQFGIGMLLFLIMYFYYIIRGADIQPNWTLALFPVLVLVMGLMGLGFGMLISAMTTKYRDLQYLVQFGIQLLMYATPVIYPISEIPHKYRWLIMANPMSGVVETFKYSFLGAGLFSWKMLIYSGLTTIIIFLFGLLIFNRTEKNFMDTV
ncbi:MAG: ABC transporter permease [Bacteroidales bacterium]|nr:ABC transporter permease [Bacteroidales bacterium]